MLNDVAALDFDGQRMTVTMYVPFGSLLSLR